MSYPVRFEKSVEQKLEKLPAADLPEIEAKLCEAVENPFYRVRRVRGRKHQGFRLGAGDYRILFQVDSKNSELLVFDVDRREKVYQQY